MAKRTGIMLPYWWDQNRFQKRYPKPAIVQPKINGNRARGVGNPHNLQYTLYSSSASEITSCPHLIEELNRKEETSWHRGDMREYDGEIYHHGWPHELISGLARTTSYVPDLAKELEYWIYDLINSDQQIVRLELLATMTDQLFPLVVVEFKLVSTVDDMVETYYNYVEQGFEGIIIRHPYEPYHRKKTTTMMKLKPSEFGEYPIVDVVQEKTIEGVPKDQAGAIALMTPDGEVFTVSGMTQAVRKMLWERRSEISGKRYAKIKYQNLSADRQVPVMPSFKELV